MFRDLDFRKFTRKATRVLLPVAGATMLFACKEPTSSILTRSTQITQTKYQITISGPDQDEVERVRKVVVVDCKGKDTRGEPELKVLTIDVPEECMKNLKNKALRNQLLAN